MKLAIQRLATYSDGSVWKDYILASDTTTYTDGINTMESTGFAALVVKTNNSITLSFEVSNDNKTWHVPFDSSGNALNSIATTLTGDRWIVYSPQLAQYTRYKVYSVNSVTTTTLTHMGQEDV